MEVKFKMQLDDSEEKSDRVGNDLLWRIDRERWLRYLEQE